MRQDIKLEIDKALSFVPKRSISDYESLVLQSNKALHDGSGKGNDFLGWLNLPSEMMDSDFAAIEDCAKRLRKSCDVVVVIGIGGRYLGARAVIDALSSSFKTVAKGQECVAVGYAG